MDLLNKSSDCLIKYIINHYFLLSAINASLVMMGFMAFAKYDLILFLASIVISVNKLRHEITAIDVFLLIFAFILIITSVGSDYPYNIWLNGVRYEFLMILFFYVGESSKSSDWKFFDNNIISILAVCVIGLFLYVYPPSWYMFFKMGNDTNLATENFILEMSRFSGFWSYPYWISYGCAIYYYYILYKGFQKGSFTRLQVAMLLFLLFITILTQQRAPMVYIALVTMLSILLCIWKRDKKRISILKDLLLIIGLVVCFSSLILSFVGQDMSERLLMKLGVLGDSSSFLKERISFFSKFANKNITFWGDGLGRYSHTAHFMGMNAITDQQYLKILYETGIFGCIGYLIIFVSILAKGFVNLKYNIFELGVIFFYLMAMTGANCLCVSQEHTIVFWFCCGRIFNKQCINYKKNEMIRVKTCIANRLTKDR